MAKRPLAKLLKKLEYHYGKMTESMEGCYRQLDFRSLDDLDDNAFAYLKEKVKGVNKLDLNETEIGNKRRKLLILEGNPGKGPPQPRQ